MNTKEVQNNNNINIYHSPEIQENVSVEQVKDQNDWSTRLITYLNQIDTKLEQMIPNNIIQEKIDKFASQIKKEFSSFVQFNDWLKENDAEDWSEQLANYLIKIPFRSAQNVISILYTIVSTALYTSVHPLEGVNYLAKSTVFLMHEITKSNNWAKLGCGSIGTLCGQSLILGNPLSVIGIGIGGALVLGGISFEAYKAAVKAEEGKKLGAIQKTLIPELKALPETMLTGFFTGILFGAIQKTLQVKQSSVKENSQIEELKRRNFSLKNSEIQSSEILDVQPVPLFEKVSDVAQYKRADWSGLIDVLHNTTVEEAKAFASSNPDITYFFYVKYTMLLEDMPYYNGLWKSFYPGEAYFFSGEPWWGSAYGMSDGYIKTFV